MNKLKLIRPLREQTSKVKSVLGADVVERRDPLFHEDGVELSGPKEALEALRTAAKNAIAEADQLGINVRLRMVRLSDEDGTVIFAGTLEQAASLAIDGSVFPHEGG